MSGTSLDGVDIAYCTFTEENGNWNYAIKYASTIAYPDELKKIVEKIIDNPSFFSVEFSNAIGSFISICINHFIIEYEIDKSEIMCISSHGQTVYHNPEKKISIQAGAGYQIAAASELTTVCDFRTLDVALNGEGAPLVPIGDLHLFKEHKACVNLGGICNLSIKDQGEIKIAYDVVACNIMLNHFAKTLDKEYDDNGEIARNGEVSLDLLIELSALDFLKKDAPKSLDAKKSIAIYQDVLGKYALKPGNLLRTFVEHIAIELNKNLVAHGISKEDKVLLTGGGALNGFLVERIKEIENLNIVIPDKNKCLKCCYWCRKKFLQWRNL